MVLRSLAASAQDPPELIVDINLDILHVVDGVYELDRGKLITLHSSHTSTDLRNEPEMFSYMMDELDIYFGRDMGRINWDLNQVAEDQSRPGYPNYTNMVSKGNQSMSWYKGLSDVHHLEEKSSMIVCPPVHPFWPNLSPTNPHQCCGGTSYTLADVSATAELFGNWLTLYHGSEGMPLPDYFEVINEPLWEMVDNNQIATVQEVFRYHKDLASAIRAITDQVQIGGFTTAIPAFEKDEFQRWDQRWKLFIDSVGASMDFFSLHFYDVYNNNGQKIFRKGSNLEATFDMVEHYSKLTLGTIKPFVISEFGAQTNNMRNTYWSPYRDWLLLKSISPMWLSFMERPHLIAKAVPFVVTKATWYSSEYPYHHRLMRKASELEGETGDHWVFTEFIKVYELWAEVKGRRIDSYSTDPDIMVDAYVEGNEAFVVINNLEFGPKTVGLKLVGQNGKQLRAVTMKHLYLDGNVPALDTTEFTEAPETVIIAAEATLVLKYTFGKDDSLDTPETSEEQKYYAESYLKPILGGTNESFQINGIDIGSAGEAILRLGIGRDHGQALQPVIHFNDSVLHVPSDFRGDSQAARSSFFGVIEVPVPYSILNENNDVSIEFANDGGHISSLSLQVFNSSRELYRSESPTKFSASFQVNSSVGQDPIEGAMIIFGGDSAYTDSNGLAVLDTIPEGIYQLKVSAPTYEPYSREDVQHSGNTHLQLSLNPLTYQLSFQLSEAILENPVYNARIDVGGATAYTNRDGEAGLELMGGKSTYRITDPYFEEISDSLFLENDTTLTVKFSRSSADVKFVIWEDPEESRLRDATVEINDTTITTNSLGLATFKLLKVDTLYNYQVSKSGMIADVGNLTLKQDSTLNIHLLASGIDPSLELQGIEIYPTPASEHLIIKMDLSGNGTLVITAVDPGGRERKIYRRDMIVGSHQISLDISDLESGIYLLILQHGEQTARRKIVIQ